MKRQTVKIKRLCQPLVTADGAIPFVYGIARRLVHHTGTPVDYEDIVGEGIWALAKAANKFTFGTGTKFTTYAYSVVQGAVMDLIRREAVANVKMPEVQLGAFEPGYTSGIERGISRVQLRVVLERVITRELSEEEAFVIKRSYFHDASNETIAEEIKCSVRKIGNVKASALLKLRSALLAYKGINENF